MVNVVMALAKTADTVIRQALSDCATYGISDRDYHAWKAQYESAKRRKIPFHFSVLGWRIWWRIALAEKGPAAQRNRGRGQYVMARKRDRGAYESGNVFVTPADRHPDDKTATTVKITTTRILNVCPRGIHLRVRGDGHPKSIAVMTPAGRFGSIALASEHYGVTRQAGAFALWRGAWVRDVPGAQLPDDLHRQPKPRQCGAAPGAMKPPRVKCSPRITGGKPRGAHLAVRGDGHPRSRAVIAPDGTRYGSAALAADAAGITRAGMALRIGAGRAGWRWA